MAGAEWPCNIRQGKKGRRAQGPYDGDAHLGIFLGLRPSLSGRRVIVPQPRFRAGACAGRVGLAPAPRRESDEAGLGRRVGAANFLIDWMMHRQREGERAYTHPPTHHIHSGLHLFLGRSSSSFLLISILLVTISTLPCRRRVSHSCPFRVSCLSFHPSIILNFSIGSLSFVYGH